MTGNGDKRPSRLAQEFTDVFRAEHRDVRDTLLDLIDAFSARDPERIEAALGTTARLTGPHFRYEEESLYPSLVQIFGGEYIDKLLGDHDVAIGTAVRLVELAEGPLSDADVEEAVRLVRSVLPHVSDCDGLSIMVERLEDDEIGRIFGTRETAQEEDLGLLEWAERVRGRPAVVPS